jgi:5-formyltetrahydrofolate cyclo-ligase
MSAAARDVASDQIADRLAVLLADKSGVLALYAAKGSEVATARIDAVARARGWLIAYPRVVGDATALAFHEAKPHELVPARFGLSEPSGDAPRVELADIAAFVVPGLAFDRAGGRLGWGRGHYDATLAAAPAAMRIGLAFECQLVEQTPREPHDVILHYIITEAATYAVAAE